MVRNSLDKNEQWECQFEIRSLKKTLVMFEQKPKRGEKVTHVVIWGKNKIQQELAASTKALCSVPNCSVTSGSLWAHGLQPARLLCPWGFSRQEYWSGLPCASPGDLPTPGIEPRSPKLQGILHPLSHHGSTKALEGKLYLAWWIKWPMSSG